MLFLFFTKKILVKKVDEFFDELCEKQHIFVVLTSTAQMHNAITTFNANAHRHYLSMIYDNNLS